jgi:outer membrane receptor protein involved in Fe transport
MRRRTTRQRAVFAAFAALAVLVVAPTLWAQNPTGTLTGRVSDNEGAGVPGVTVSATSPALQGDRQTQTSGNGDYKLPFLPPGVYQVTYELEGFKSAVREAKISAAQTTLSDVSLEVGEVTEEITVVGAQSTISETNTGASTVTGTEIEALAVNRTVAEAVNLVPGVATNIGYNASSSPSVSGAPTFENLFMVNGIVINENIRGDILPLFIEDAVQETTTAVSGVSAEYGRFTGGVVNAITKSGGNEFDGSFRVNLSNQDWEGTNRLSPEQTDKVNKVYEATLGGFLWKDHIWFFGAGRDFETASTLTLDITNIPFPATDEERRLEGKLTVTPHPSHSVIGSYLEIERTRGGTRFAGELDLRSVNANREDPQEIKSVNYTGILTSSFFIEGQYSERDFIIARGAGGVPDLILGTMIRTRNQSFRYWAPTFCGACEDQSRNNENLLGKASYFLSTEGGGTHDLSFGYDTFEDSIFSINHQTGSDFTVYGSNIVRGPGNSIPLDNTFGSPFPIFNTADTANAPWVEWFAVFNEDLARPSSFNTNSFYVNDRWQLNDKWSFNLGVRYDENDGQNSAGATVATDDKISPRLGATWDMKGDGDWVFNASYGTYVAALASSANIADGSSSGGAIGDFLFLYGGPSINVGCTPNVNCLNAQQVLQQVFAWYQSVGGVFDLSQINANSPAFRTLAQGGFLLGSNIPGATTQIIGGIASPSVDEITLGVTKRLGTKGLFRADVVLREWDDFYGNRTDLVTGRVPTSAGPADLTLRGNFSNGINREYKGLHTQFRYRFTDRLTLAGNYTLSNAEGNFDGETGPNGPISANSQSYPEYREAFWNYPDGDLRIDQRHKARVWAVYDVVDTDHHRLSASLLQNFFSGQPYAANANVNPAASGGVTFVPNPGYVTPPTALTYYFSARDGFHTDDVTRTDVALNYAFVFNAWGREIEMFLQPEVINIFNEDAVIDPLGLDDNEGITVLRGRTANPAGVACTTPNGANCRQFNPHTETPEEGRDWLRQAQFGQPLNDLDFQQPRTFRFSVGLRF